MSINRGCKSTLRLLISIMAISFLIVPLTFAVLPQPMEYQMGVGGGGVFRAIAGRNGVILAGSDVAGLFRSLDNGKTWHIANSIKELSLESGMSSIMVNDILWHPMIENRVIVATMDGIYTSDNPHLADGPDWTRQTPGSNPDLNLYDGFKVGLDYPPGSHCFNDLHRNWRQGAVAALTAYVDSDGNTTIFGVSGYSLYQQAPQKSTNRDLLWKSTDGGYTWTYHRIRLPEDPPCSGDSVSKDQIYSDSNLVSTLTEASNTADWRRTFSDVEVFGGRVFVTALEGQGVLSAPLTDLNNWRGENAGLPFGNYMEFQGYHPAQMTRFDPDGSGPAEEELYLAIFTTADPIPPCNDEGSPCSGIYRWHSGSEPYWEKADAEATSPLPLLGWASPYYSWFGIKSFQTSTWGRLFTAWPNGSDLDSNRGAIFYSDDGRNWYPLAQGYWLDHEGSINECGTDGIYRQLGVDVGPYEYGRDRFMCCNNSFIEWYPNPGYQFGKADRFLSSSSPPAFDESLYLLDSSSGFHELDYDYNGTSHVSSIPRPTNLLTTKEMTETCSVAGEKDFNDNPMKCWADASIANLPDISGVGDFEILDGKLWLSRADWTGSQWRFDLEHRNWEEFLMPMWVPVVQQNSPHSTYDLDMGTEIWSIAARPGSSEAGEDQCGQDLNYPMLVFGGPLQAPPAQAGLIIKGIKCEGEWHFKAIGMVEQTSNPNSKNYVCPRNTGGYAPRDDYWEPCRGNVIDLVYLPPRAGDGTEGRGRFLAAVTGRLYDCTLLPPNISGPCGELGIYWSIEGDDWIKLPKNDAAGWPDWWDSSHCNEVACIGSNDAMPFVFSQVGDELFLSFNGFPYELPIESVSGIWRWKAEPSLAGGGVFERVPMNVPLLSIAGVARDARGSLIVSTGIGYHIGAPMDVPPYEGQTHRAGVYRCEESSDISQELPSCQSWSTLRTVPDWNYSDTTPSDKYFVGSSAGLVAASKIGPQTGSFYFAGFYSNVSRSSGGVPLCVSEDGGMNWSFEPLARGFRNPVRLKLLNLGGQNHLALLGQAGIFVLDFDCHDNDLDGYGSTMNSSCPAGSDLDCNDLDSSIWATPGEVRNLRFEGHDKTTLIWDLPAAPGAVPEALLYDTLRSESPEDFISSLCVESDDGPDRTATDPEMPAVEHVFYYLVRAINSCPNGEGPLGYDSLGQAREGRSCP